MTRYGYHDMPENYTDIGGFEVRAICQDCKRRQYVLREDAWHDRQINPMTGFVTDDLCSEFDGEYIDDRQHEW